MPKETISPILPHYPDLSLDDFLRLSEETARAKRGGDNPGELGNLTIEFVQFFFRDPLAAMRAMSDDYVASGAFKRDMAEVRFLRQERLNGDLAEFLADFGFAPDEVRYCRDHARVNETTRSPDRPRTSWTPNGIDHVRTRERYLFAMLAQLGHCYEPPRPGAALGR